MNSNLKIKMAKFVAAFLLVCFASPVFANNAPDDEKLLQLKQDIAATINKAGAFGRVTLFGKERMDGWALIDFTAKDEKDHRVLIIVEEFTCLSQITPDLEDANLLCLNGDIFIGKVTADTGDSTRVKGTFANYGEAKITLTGVELGDVDKAMKRLNPTEYEKINLLKEYSPKKPAANVAIEKQTFTDSNETNIPTLLENIDDAEEFCAELGFEKQSGSHAMCALKFLRKLAND